MIALWTYPGASEHGIDPNPVDTLASFGAGTFQMMTESPPGFDLRGQTEVIITLMYYNQYLPFTNDLWDHPSYDPASPSSCTDSWNRNASQDVSVGANVGISILAITLVTRSHWQPDPNIVPSERPRLFGGDAEWMIASVNPFLDATCVRDTSWHPGWGGGEGVPDFKGQFEMASLGYSSCLADQPEAPATIFEHGVVAASYANPAFNSHRGATEHSHALKTFHMLRRIRACHAANAAVPATADTIVGYAIGTQCRRVASQIASQWGLVANGNSLEVCSQQCLQISDCYFMSRSADGYCRFFSACHCKTPVTVRALAPG